MLSGNPAGSASSRDIQSDRRKVGRRVRTWPLRRLAGESPAQPDRGASSLFHRYVPHASAECRNEYHFAIRRVGNDTVPPLKVIPVDAFPTLAAIGGPPCRGFESARVQRVRLARVDRDIVDVLIFIEHIAPA